MKKPFPAIKKPFRVVAVLLLLAVVFAGGAWYGRRDASAPIWDVPPQSAGFDAAPGDPAETTPGTVEISPERQQLIGVKTEVVARSAGGASIRLLGRVAADETRVYAINATLDGWITDAPPLATWTYVRKHQTLATFYSPDFLSAEQALIFALGAQDRAGDMEHIDPSRKARVDQFNLNLQQYKDSLRNLGMGERQIERIGREREFIENVDITSPASGFILARNISQGLRFAKGTELFRIADLSRVWVLAETYENEADQLQPGTRVTVTTPASGKRFTARVSNSLPQFDPATRTLRVRLELANPGYVLKPDMFVNVELPVAGTPAIFVPTDAVIDSGLRKTVFVARGNGFFEPRQIETGRRLQGRVEVTGGLAEGERIVTAGAFLIDSESRMSLAADGMDGGMAACPVCGTSVAIGKAQREGLVSVVAGRTHHFASAACKERFDREQAAPVPAPVNRMVVTAGAARGMAGKKKDTMHGRRAMPAESGRTAAAAPLPPGDTPEQSVLTMPAEELPDSSVMPMRPRRAPAAVPPAVRKSNGGGPAMPAAMSMPAAGADEAAGEECEHD